MISYQDRILIDNIYKRLTSDIKVFEIFKEIFTDLNVED